ncbi:Cupin domain-containing protein [Sediminihabitans luteus]|uniref:Cupin domain-containing protein n=1 Tax=Sediminihabitans luteus TaxID=1138585 RepID=A0A2M9CZU6_9CELL|nr:cupin domain-containing protein [Sediminihabitans luteus]PJJ77429.1 Cupin domain-containing protein [Sediminihabitans luteus]GII98322.1 hypothetical protein Slu03_07000 [Sediminihabitans luteus]
MSDPLLPGGTSASHLRVYDWPAADAPGGSGSPHLHTVASEAYVVTAGAGAVQTLSADGYAERPLEPGRVVWFTPGVVHRLVNHGGLELVVLMSDAGLPEAGDAVLTFPPAVLADPDAYRAAATLPAAGAGAGASSDSLLAVAARARRDLALEGYLALRDAVVADGPGALAPLHAAAARLVGPRLPGWAEAPAVVAAAGATTAALAALVAGGADAVAHLAAGTVAERDALPGPRRYGMCGRLRQWSVPTA